MMGRSRPASAMVPRRQAALKPCAQKAHRCAARGLTAASRRENRLDAGRMTRVWKRQRNSNRVRLSKPIVSQAWGSPHVPGNGLRYI